MKKHDLLSLFSDFALPGLLWVVGTILLVHPDSASMLIARVLGWGILLLGIGFAVSLFAAQRGGAFLGKLAAAILCVGLGSWLIRNPLAPASFIGRLLGIVLAIRGGQEFFQGSGKIWGLITLVLGGILVALPMSASRLVFSLTGLAMVLVGIAMVIDRLRRRRLESGNDDPNIIDAL